MSHELGRGVVKDKAVFAALTSPLFKSKREKSKKGKGSYQRLNRDWKENDYY